MFDTLAVAQELTAGGVDRDQAEVIANAMRQAAAHGEHLTPDQFKTGIAELRTELRTEIAEVRTEVANLDTRLSGQIANLDTRLSGQIGEVRTEVASLDTRLSGQIGEGADRGRQPRHATLRPDR